MYLLCLGKGKRERIPLRIWVGIDVCQKYLDIYVRPLGNLFQITNDEVGINKLVQILKNIQPELIVSTHPQKAALRA